MTVAGNPGRPDIAPTVLVVDDNRSIRMIVKRLLEDHGCRVLDACSGEEALAVELPVDAPLRLLVTDVRMPELGGLELGRRLAVRHPQLRIIFMSGNPDAEVEALCREQPGYVFLQKPFTIEILMERVRNVLPLPG